MEQQKNKKVMLSIIGIAILVIGLVGITYAFFNYTRTGTANIIKTGRINFNSEQGTSINLTNLFPIDVSEGIPNDNTKVGTATINITGDTTYGEGIEYLVSAVNVTNTVGSKNLPISIDVSVTYLGTSDDDYFEDRGSTTSYYKVLAPNTIEDNSELLVGYIAPGAEGIDGNIVIKAYLDESKIAISDTYPEGDVTHTEGVEPDQTTVTDYTNGTTTEWVNDREVFTTTEWNSLQTNGVSFKVKVEANEGIWVEETTTTAIPTCPGCKFIYTTNVYYYSDNNSNSEPVSTLEDFASNNDVLVDDYHTLNRKVFIGYKFNDVTHEIEKAYGCGIKGESPNEGTAFCIEGSTDGSTYNDNVSLLNGPTLWNNSCSISDYISCTGEVGVNHNPDGDIGIYGMENSSVTDICYVNYDGNASCS